MQWSVLPHKTPFYIPAAMYRWLAVTIIAGAGIYHVTFSIIIIRSKRSNRYIGRAFHGKILVFMIISSVQTIRPRKHSLLFLTWRRAHYRSWPMVSISVLPFGDCPAESFIRL